MNSAVKAANSKNPRERRGPPIRRPIRTQSRRAGWARGPSRRGGRTRAAPPRREPLGLPAACTAFWLDLELGSDETVTWGLSFEVVDGNSRKRRNLIHVATRSDEIEWTIQIDGRARIVEGRLVDVTSLDVAPRELAPFCSGIGGEPRFSPRRDRRASVYLFVRNVERPASIRFRAMKAGDAPFSELRTLDRGVPDSFPSRFTSFATASVDASVAPARICE